MYSPLYRLGYGGTREVRGPEEEVNEYLSRAIDARSIERLHSDHVKRISLHFRKTELESQVYTKTSLGINYW